MSGVQAMRMQRSMVVIVGAALALLVAGIVVALVASRRAEAPYPPDSPEGTVATYLRLLQSGQADQAYGLAAMDRDRQDFIRQYGDWSRRSHRVPL